MSGSDCHFIERRNTSAEFGMFRMAGLGLEFKSVPDAIRDQRLGTHSPSPSSMRCANDERSRGIEGREISNSIGDRRQ